MQKSDYSFSKIVDFGYEEAIEKVSEELKKEGFGILTEIDVKATLKEKIDVDFKPYKILGACNPPFAHKALSSEINIGLMLPCNVIVYVNKNDKTVVAAVDPLASMQAVENPELKDTATQVREKLGRVIENV